MKHRNKKLGVSLMACTLCFTVLSACSSGESSSAPETPVQSNQSASSNLPDVSQGTPDEASDTPFSKFTGKSLGEFTMQDINGQTYTQEMFEDYDLTMVNIFTTWCTPCVAEIPDLEELHRSMKDKGVNVVGVVLDILNEKGGIEQESLEKAQLLAKRTGATYPFLIPDSSYMNGRLMGIESFPETFFVDKNGNIVGETYSGSRSLEDWMEVVQQELASLEEGS